MNYKEKHDELVAMMNYAKAQYLHAISRLARSRCREQRVGTTNRITHWRSEICRLEQEMQGLDYAWGEMLNERDIAFQER